MFHGRAFCQPLIKRNDVRAHAYPPDLFIAKLIIGIHTQLGIGALCGGAAFIIDPGGKLIGMHFNFLTNSPFNNFLLPDIILLLVLGVAYWLAMTRELEAAEVLDVFPEMNWSWTYPLYNRIRARYMGSCVSVLYRGDGIAVFILSFGRDSNSGDHDMAIWQEYYI
ncbi:MAG: hypothetical protein ACLP05_00900 [Candidatus Kryptoniota bacterium]